MKSYSLRCPPEKSARAKELANVIESQKSRAPAPPLRWGEAGFPDL